MQDAATLLRMYISAYTQRSTSALNYVFYFAVAAALRHKCGHFSYGANG